VNHSCDPNISVVLPANKPKEWGIKPLRDIKKGEDMTFFYPSTEWDMAQGFDCSCGSSVSVFVRGIEGADGQNCIGKIAGAKHISIDDLEKRGGMSEHIRTMKEQKE
jgi:hypothetical protein